MKQTGTNDKPTNRIDGTIKNKKLAEVVAEWQRKLLELGRRNNLLYFHSGKTAVHIVGHTPDSIMAALESSRRGLTFDYAEPKPSGHRDRFAKSTLVEDQEFEPSIKQGDLKSDCPAVELQRRLGNLRRRAREWEEEQGLHVLFLALGYLRWVDEDGESALAPLLLLPCRLEKPSPRDAFILSHDEDDLTTNTTLAVKLKDVGITLPDASAGVDIAKQYIDAVRELINQRPGWKVEEDIYLSTFSYSKLAMWTDLEVIRKNGTANNIVLTLASANSLAQKDHIPPTPLPLNAEDLAGAKLDDLLKVHDQYSVLPADYSQLLAITAARSGQNLVVHGPPGTGKSQTIANIIATLMAEGKSVLFVSEKTAALDVVKRRLDEKQLGVFCLDLHSERGNKANVYQQLGQSIDSNRTIKRFDFDYTALTERRQRLNNIVRALHQVREPLQATIFEVHGRFTSIQGAPHVAFEVENIEGLNPERLTEMLEAADRVRLRSKEFKQHFNSHWKVLKSGTPALELANKIRQDMRTLNTAIMAVYATPHSGAEILGVSFPETIEETSKFESLVLHLIKAPSIPHEWLEEGALMQLKISAASRASIQAERTVLIENLSSILGSPIPEWDYSDLQTKLNLTTEGQRSLKALLGERWNQYIIQGGQSLSTLLHQLNCAVGKLKLVNLDTAHFLQASPPDTWNAINSLHKTIQKIGLIGAVPTCWVEPQGTGTILATIDKAQSLSQKLETYERRLLTEFESGLFDAIDQKMLARFNTDHQGGFHRLFSKSYKSDRKTLHAFQLNHKGMPFDHELTVVKDVIELKKGKIEWEQGEPTLASTLGKRYNGRNTNWTVIRQNITDTRNLLQGQGMSGMHMATILSNTENIRKSQELNGNLQQVISEVQSLLLRNLDAGTVQRVLEDKIPLTLLENLLSSAGPVMERIEGVVAVINAQVAYKFQDLQALQNCIKLGARLQEIEREQTCVFEGLQKSFGDRYKGFSTNWEDINKCLTWTDELLVIIPSSAISVSLASHITQPRSSSFYESIAKTINDALQNFYLQIEALNEDYDFNDGPLAQWRNDKFESLQELSQDLSDDADSASDWLLYLTAADDLERIIGASTVDRIRHEIDNSELVPGVIKRRVLGAWLDWNYKHEPLLGTFTSSEQENLISKFKELDIQLAVAAQNEVRKKVYERYPLNASTNVGELGILRGELAKRRRQRSVRRLFHDIPHLIQTLKPCIMVSPLAISQFLPFSSETAETLNFDVVIFDEASQVFPEDAMPAILRGKQIILAGDRKQLPPSSFWKCSLEDEIDYDDENMEELPNQLTGIESILDASVGHIGDLFNEAHLNVHYRSKDESLIRFSNHCFYEDRLLTFPSPGIKGESYGVHDSYVSDGRYDAGATRTNRKEAVRVVELVFEHMRIRPIGESLGVVALSRPQADLIEQLVDERRLLERDVDERFKERPDEPFFVKNLENVQGDERDHMIISIGYGPTVESGAVPNRFGPLNAAGGERRLNVAITRARKRMDVVHSLRASDIHSEQLGAKFLKRYLEYAANPRVAFEGQITEQSPSEADSPFENAVQRALINRGHKVVNQVGVSGYRIDLAILSEDGTKHDLGIECDGWTYHSAPAARDRDWLRQQVLEGLGWRLHRVWSTAWVRNQQAEVARIEADLALARAGKGTTPNINTSKQSLPPENSLDNVSTVEISPLCSGEVQLCKYQETVLPYPGNMSDLRYESQQKIISIIKQIAEFEGPIHRDVVRERIRQTYRLDRLSGGAKENVERALMFVINNKVVCSDAAFIWAQHTQLRRMPRYPVDENIEHIYPSELQAIIKSVILVTQGVGRDDLVSEVSRKLGFNRTGGRIAEILGNIISELLNGGFLVESFGMIRLKENAPVEMPDVTL